MKLRAKSERIIGCEPNGCCDRSGEWAATRPLQSPGRDVRDCGHGQIVPGRCGQFRCQLRRSRTGLVPFLLLWLVAAGCGTNEPTEHAEPEYADPRSAAEIWGELRDTYARADSYVDQGRIYLSYRLDGQRYEEPQPWATEWKRGQGMAAHYFNARIRWNGRLMDAFVFDIETANLDGQQLLVESGDESGLLALLRDPIAGPFVAGLREMPLNEANPTVREMMLPPMLGWLTDRLPSFLDTLTEVVRRPDATVDERVCTVLDCSHGDEVFRLWIDSATRTLVQLQFPSVWLAPEVLESPDITDVQLVAKFHEAQLNAAVNPQHFEIERRADAHLVRQLIPIPEPLPIEKLGRKIEAFPLKDAMGQPLDLAAWKDRAVVLVWFSDRWELLETIEAIRREFDDADVVFLAVASDDQVRVSSGGTTGLDPVREQWLRDHRISLEFAVDPNMELATALAATAMPLAVIVDRGRVAQYARAIGDEGWRTELVAALQRVLRGEPLAREMMADYARYLDDYRQQLEMVDATSLLDPDVAAEIKSNRFELSEVWRSNSLSQPRYVTSDGRRTLVIDGLLTVVELDSKGMEVRRRAVELKTGEGITRVVPPTAGAANLFAVYGLLGRQLAIGDWRRDGVAEWPEDPASHDGITHVEWAKRPSDVADLQSPILAVSLLADPGLVVGPVETADVEADAVAPGLGFQPKGLVAGAVTSMTTGAGGFYIQNGELYSLASRQRVDVAGQFRQVCGRSRLAVALNLDSLGRWHLFGVQPDGTIGWRHPVGEPLLNESMDFLVASRSPVDLEATDAGVVFGYMDRDYRLTLLDAAGRVLGTRQVDSSVASFAVVSDADRVWLYLSDDQGVGCFEVLGLRQDKQ